jgi:hypothetical protein
MIEYIRHIEEYFIYEHSSFSNLVPSENWGNKELAEKYLQKYWLTEKEYLSTWKSIQDNIFIQGKGLPDIIYHPEFEIIALRGGCLFMEEDFKQLQQAMTAIGETHFVVIQSAQDYTQGEPMFRMKFPVAISWEELMSGNYISAVLFEMNRNEYLVFGNSGKLAKYAASDQDHPQDIIGFKPILKSVMDNCFKSFESL